MLTPIILTNEELDNYERQLTETSVEEASKTWRIDSQTGEIFAEFIDSREAIEQAIVKAIKTTREQYMVYTSDYGADLSMILGKSYSEAYLRLEIPRLIDEALMPDDRVISVSNFNIKKDLDIVYVSFTVNSVVGEIAIEEVRF